MKVRARKQTVIGIVIAGILGLSYLLFGDVRLFVSRAVSVLNEANPRDLEAGVHGLRSYLISFGAWAPIVSGILMVLQMIIAPIPGQLITFTNGLLFGSFWGTVLSWTSAMIGATICFGIASAFGRPVVEKIIGKTSLDYVDKFFERYGTKTVLIARLIPFVPFDPVSYGAGLTRMGFRGFFIATAMGQLPATILYSWLGDKATGSIKAVFWMFTGVIAIAITFSIIKPWFDRRIVDSDFTRK